MCSNHKDAVIKSRGDRRYCVFYTAQQTPEDMKRAGVLNDDGSSTAYFPDLYNWLRAEGYAIVANYLNTYQIRDELNPATSCMHAPATSSTSEVIMMSLGGVEQEILEAVEEKRYGFSGGWISSMALDRMLEARRDQKRITRNKRRELLYDLGYIQHPHLPKGRVNNLIPGDGGKPVLYIKEGSLLINLHKVTDIAARYMKDQSGEAIIEGNTKQEETR